jgi:hypothetical protein
MSTGGIADCGLRIADCELRIADCGLGLGLGLGFRIWTNPFLNRKVKHVTKAQIFPV